MLDDSAAVTVHCDDFDAASVEQKLDPEDNPSVAVHFVHAENLAAVGGTRDIRSSGFVGATLALRVLHRAAERLGVAQANAGSIAMDISRDVSRRFVLLIVM
ncbi:MAG: hypothetical protein NVV73_09160 [Cellvibrionaceae bacterium]|nr:hypothetical protein [Cellvibrionaceae bacterium]